MRRFSTWTTGFLFLMAVGLPSYFISFTAQASLRPCVQQLTIQEERFTKQLGLIRTFNNSHSSPKASNEKILNDVHVVRDVRTHFFRLQALLRAYKEIEGDTLEISFVRVKEAEDGLGMYGDRIDFHDIALKLYRDGYLDHLAPIHYMKVMREEEKKRLEVYLNSVPSLLHDVEESLENIDWRGQKKDALKVLDFLVSEIESYMDLPFDMDNLEKGIHEMRRKLRWLLLYIQSLEGMIRLVDGISELGEYDYLTTHPIANGPFTKLTPSFPVKHGADMPREYFLALSKAVEELGVIKSVGEIHEALIEAYVGSGAAASRNEAKKIVEEKLRHHPLYSMDIHAKAEQVKAGLLRSGVLRKTHDLFKEARKRLEK